MNAQVLNAYFEKSHFTLAEMQAKGHKNFADFLSGKKVPTFNQLKKIARLLDIPTGLLLLSKPIEVRDEVIKFRTINSQYLVEQSNELKDTIALMRSKQEFLQSQIDEQLSFIGTYNLKDDPQKVVAAIQHLLGLETTYFEKVSQEGMLKFFRQKLNKVGVFVFFNGKYENNTHRPLKVQEFRGFVLVDKKAPLIFINQRDTKNGKLFTLVHEFVHLLLGEDEIYGTQSKTNNFDPTETFVNKITAEILVPTKIFLSKYQESLKLMELAEYFKVSRYVIARKMLDNQKISLEKYQELIEEFDKDTQSYQVSKQKSGGHFYNSLRYSVDENFVSYVTRAIDEQKISYTDAFGLLGVTGYQGYQELKGDR